MIQNHTPKPRRLTRRKVIKKAPYISARDLARVSVLFYNQSSFRKLWLTLRKVDGAYSTKTLRRLRVQFINYLEYCERIKVRGYPSLPKHIVRHLEDLYKQGLTATSIRMTLWAISAMHRWNRHEDTTSHPKVKLGMRRIYRLIGCQQRQALGIRRSMLDAMLAVNSQDLMDTRLSTFTVCV